MPTQEYRNARGDRLPGTTYVIGSNLGWNKDGLMAWANREGLAGRNIRGEKSTGRRAADIGTVGHAMVEEFIHGRDPEALPFLPGETEDMRSKSRQAFGSFLRWFRQSRIQIIGTELYGVDEGYETGFCIDALCLEDNEGTPELSLGDVKTSNGTYADHFIQVSAYTVFVERKLKQGLGTDIRLAGAHLWRLSKDSSAFVHHFWPREILELGWKAFSWARALHSIRRQVESQVR